MNNEQKLLAACVKMPELERENAALRERKELYRNDYDYQFARRVELEQLVAAVRRALDPDDQMSALSLDEIAALQSVELRELRAALNWQYRDGAERYGHPIMSRPEVQQHLRDHLPHGGLPETTGGDRQADGTNTLP